MNDTISSLAQRLRPFWLKDLGASSPSSSGGGSGMVAHALNGPYHTGTLDEAQAPWAVDTTTFTTHTGNPDAHHPKLHNITDAANHSATGAQYQVVGLTAVNTLGLLTPSSSPAANAIIKTDGASSVTLVDLTVTSDLFVVGTLDFGTDVMFEDATYLRFSGAKPVRFAQTIGSTNWTISDTGAATFNGNVDVLAGGDLTVIGTGAYAGSKVLFADSSGGNVGIMMNPDSQFALDVNGPARATYFIGPHAIQLKGVLMLAHFDGREPYETNYSGDLNGHMGQVASPVGGITFRAGKFYKAAQLALGTTNLVSYPSFESGTLGSAPDGWTNGGVGTFVKSSDVSLFGLYSGKLVVAAQQGFPVSTVANINLANAYTVSAWVYLSSVTTGSIKITLQRTDTFVEVCETTADMTKIGEWQRVVATYAGGGSGTVGARVKAQTTAGATMTVYLDGFQLEQRNFATPYCDGTMGGYSGSGVPDGSGHTWAGTAHASNSTRTASGLSYPVSGNLDINRGTIMCWVYVEGHDPSANEGIFDAGSAWPYFGLWMNAGTTPSAIIGGPGGHTGAGGPAAPGMKQWVHVAFTWDGYWMTVYTNGVAGTPIHYTNWPVFGTNFSVGSLQTLGGYRLNGLIDDFVILDRTLTAIEIRTVYESNAPVFAETSTFTFRPTPKGLIWADDEGLWMRDTLGNPVLGVYGGEAATKNWASMTMEAGDIVFGRNVVGSSAIWWDQNAGKFGFYGGGSGTPQVEIATDGKLTAGGGKVKLDSAGFHAFNASNVGTIDIDANGISTGDGGARSTVASWTSGSRIKWYATGEIYAATPESYLDDSSISRNNYPLVVRAIRQGNESAMVEISAVNTSNAGAFIRVGEAFRLKDYYGTPYFTNRMVHLLATDVILEATNLQLRSLTTSGAAVGAYSGKVRIQINGTNYYIPYYAS